MARTHTPPLRNGELPRAGGSAGVALSTELVFAQLLEFKGSIATTLESVASLRTEIGTVATQQQEMIGLLREMRDLLQANHERSTQLLESLWKGGEQMLKLEERMRDVEVVVQERVEQERRGG